MIKSLVQYFKLLLSMQQPIGAASNMEFVEIIEEEACKDEHEQPYFPKFDW